MLDSQGYAVLRASLWPSICRTETRHVAACDRAGDLLGYRLQAEPTGLQRLKVLDHDVSLSPPLRFAQCACVERQHVRGACQAGTRTTCAPDRGLLCELRGARAPLQPATERP
jgi:hypothetical protein